MLEVVAAMVIGAVIAAAYLYICMELLPVLAAEIRLALRIARMVFLGIGWIVVITRLLLS